VNFIHFLILIFYSAPAPQNQQAQSRVRVLIDGELLTEDYAARVLDPVRK
jgi:hypothetical protein